MNYLDWIVLGGTVAFIVLYGVWRTRATATMEGYLKGDNTMKWWMIGVSIMATQASAVTFLSTTGQGIEDGMRFLQFYFGLPLAMIIISATIVPIYYRLKVYTAYEYLESRFDRKTRYLTAGLFLILRGLSAGITLYAPSLVLSTLFGWPMTLTTLLIGSLVIVYVVLGGTKAVSITQRQQMAVIMSGMILAGILAWRLLPGHVSFGDTVTMAGELGKLNLVNLKFNPNDRYNVWSGLIAGTFLFLAYFGTDQSQVARYLGGASLTESRLGLVFNGLLKIPMQFLILFIGVLVSIFYLFHQPPVYHNQVLKNQAFETSMADTLAMQEIAYDALYKQKRVAVDELVDAIHSSDAVAVDRSATMVKELQAQERLLRDSVKKNIGRALKTEKTNDQDYIFLNFVLNNLPHGVIGLLLAVIFLAAMSSMASELNALASTTCMDIYRQVKPGGKDVHYLAASRWFTLLWAVLAMVFTTLARFADNLIQFVNIVGSLFYGTILGIFMTAFYLKRVGGTAVFVAAIISEIIVLMCYKFTAIAFLHYNLIGCASVIILSLVFTVLSGKRHAELKP